ncbi:MAG: PadR family transcriptional regulator [Dehalococcoidia bacterium]|nr:PadR family transcriptional regulator [Dehalococcoidia bacterium]
MFDRSVGGDLRGMFREIVRDLGRGWQGRGRSGFERGDMRYVVLALLEKQPMHGYEIIRELERRFEGTYAPSPGTVYPTLQMLEDMGYVTSVEREGKRVYTINDAGRAHLDENSERVDSIWERTGSDSHSQRYSEDAKQLWQEYGMLAPTLNMLSRRASPEQAAKMRDILVKARRDMEDVLRSAT